MFHKKVSLFLFLMVFTVKSSYSQCAMCKAVVENGDVSMAEGVNNGISYLMVFPYLLIAALFYTLYRYRKQTKN
ncbi:hypothetical protein BW723_09045 [Polaribacter reichenbachii]|uniref:Uncharacterized protein n=1 Tax=Polaribacter reichenbachii TaxID=996801 RepID=A0A1B8U7E2_9FLAO|nr:hypothetical protein [Polaribacter reichenbachii]APZ46431.1 hypothetical protein BW723_09045 [Polaribacter reichenbachii]AUC20296.1 hypothetical protein BTO17_17080 [Polaribacter reichenbachii]OBY67803.1 hypothetical protein LPB301_00455 [Polaribacter reichenbachii]